MTDLLVRILRLRVALLGLVGFALIAYLSWRPSPDLTDITWLPNWLSTWSNLPGNWDRRTFVPHFLLSSYIAAEMTWSFRHSKSLPFLLWILGVYALGALLIMTECAQVWIPGRFASWSDMRWGGLGILLGGWPIFVKSIICSIREALTTER
ncbi:hypothetical protein SH580_06625 [Coraliomargarita algicola]|uniref:VanZ-like domain-containing protein n=1 Tax=Coraliomargarita algicola TaxID=3092156 RepID=A0ABZ0RMP4_9BACT|nr:hypothetical protein [Coraliomargarita sp. J2-16]WPJ97382.1 hypothetical protein SH580_06625 [Coraliomargarita sp. J2-16]